MAGWPNGYPLLVRYLSNEEERYLEFPECVLDVLAMSGAPLNKYDYHDEVPAVYFHWDGSKTLTLSHRAFEDSRCVPMGHFSPCPMGTCDRKDLPKDQKVRVAAAVLVVCNGHVLVTRRALHMRTFPGIWVLPGGHVDGNETLEEAAVREVLEETGLRVSCDDVEACAMWESVFPQLREWGPPKRHHVILYFIARYTHDDPDDTALPHVTMDPGEVDMYAWLDVPSLRSLLDAGWHLTPPEDADNGPCFAAHVISTGTETEATAVPLAELNYLYGEKNRISTATRYVLEKFLLSLEGKGEKE